MDARKSPGTRPRGNAASETEEEKAMRLAETTDLSPLQARELMRRHGKDSPKVATEAKNFKAES